MKTVLAVLSTLLLSTAVYVSVPEKNNIPDLGVCVVEFNAGFNSANRVRWMDQLSDCKGERVDIVVKPKLQVKHNIVVVPTVIIFNDGLEVKRFQANIMMELSASKEEVQEAIDDILMGSF